jgi:hypothetical protein
MRINRLKNQSIGALKLFGAALFLLIVATCFCSLVWASGRDAHSLPAQTSLGGVWHTTEYGGWTGTWTRRGDSLVFDAIWINGSQKVTGVFTMTVQGNTVRIQSRQQSNGNAVDYEGILDGRTASGELWVVGQSGRRSWRASIEI